MPEQIPPFPDLPLIWHPSTLTGLIGQWWLGAVSYRHALAALCLYNMLPVHVLPVHVLPVNVLPVHVLPVRCNVLVSSSARDRTISHATEQPHSQAQVGSR